MSEISFPYCSPDGRDSNYKETVSEEDIVELFRERDEIEAKLYQETIPRFLKNKLCEINGFHWDFSDYILDKYELIILFCRDSRHLSKSVSIDFGFEYWEDGPVRDIDDQITEINKQAAEWAREKL